MPYIVIGGRMNEGRNRPTRAPGMLATLLLLLVGTAWAEQARDYEDHVIHYNALTTDALPPAIATAYGITRSSQRAMLNITVMEKAGEGGKRPVAADIEVSAVNLSAQHRNIEMRQVVDGDAVYHVGEFGITDGETLEFDVRVRPEGSDRSYRFSFRQTFYTK